MPKWWPWSRPPAKATQASVCLVPLHARLDDNLQLLQESFGRSPDLAVRRFTVELPTPTAAALVFLNDLVRNESVSDYILTPLLVEARRVSGAMPKEELPATLGRSLVTSADAKALSTLDQALQELVDGKVLLLCEGSRQALALLAPNQLSRAIDEPQVEQVITGPRDGFVESIEVNRMLIRRRLRTPRLRMESFRLGRLTATNIALIYIQGIAADDVVAEVKKRLQRVDVDAVLAIQHIEELIEDSPFSFFPTWGSTERPDVCIAQLLEGSVAIIADGSPVCLFAPVTFFTFFQSPDDYYSRYAGSTWVRGVRLLGLLTSTIMPALAVAIINFHPELLPVSLLISIAEGRERVPFPLLVEILGMDITFELLREAGLRMPRSIGQALSVLGALVLGQAAIQAGLVGPHAILIVAVTAITSFLVGRIRITQATRLLRFALLFAAGALGILGLMLLLIAVFVHQVSLRSLGVPYMYPLAPLDLQALKDVLIRAPRWWHRQRPDAYLWRQSIRHDTARPKPPQAPQEG
jgi:spore germination protein KA